MMKILLVLITTAIAVVLILLLVRLRYDRLVKQIWRSLKVRPSEIIFTRELVADLDEPVQRYFLHAIAPGTPLANYVELQMSGSFRLQPNGDWLPMSATQIISTAPGLVWRASIGKLLGFSGADYYSGGKGRMRFSLWGLLPLVNASDRNIARSGAGRLGAEFIWLPSALLPHNGVTWQAIADNVIQAKFTIDSEPITLTLTIAPDGKLLKLSLPRWGDKTENSEWQYIPFGGEVREEKNFDGYSVPVQMIAGWWFGTDRYRPFFQTSIELAKFS